MLMLAIHTCYVLGALVQTRTVPSQNAPTPTVCPGLPDTDATRRSTKRWRHWRPYRGVPPAVDHSPTPTRQKVFIIGAQGC